MPESSIPVLTRETPLAHPLSPAMVLLDKPKGITSFGVVRRVRRLIGVKRVGHAGTLDPMATGLLIVLAGREATRRQDEFMGLPKAYTGTLRLGERTLSYDAETDVAERRDPGAVADADLEAVRKVFLGEIQQLPPMYSAVKVGGERLYRKARRGEEITRVPRPVTIFRLEFACRRGADVDFLVECSKGTYVRSLAHDIGEALGVGAHLVALRREAIGQYHVRDAWPLEDLETAVGRMGDEG